MVNLLILEFFFQKRQREQPIIGISIEIKVMKEIHKKFITVEEPSLFLPIEVCVNPDKIEPPSFLENRATLSLQ